MTSFTNSATRCKHQASPVFKTPMTFNPRVVGDQVCPSPSRVDLWRAELGLEDTPDSDHENSEEEAADDLANVADTSNIDLQALRHELEQRNVQRDELLLSVKVLNDKNKQYRCRLEREEAARKRQMRILQKSHEAHLEERQRLVRSLELTISELEQKGTSLEHDATDSTSSHFGSLVSEVKRLQTEKTELTSRILELEGAIEEYERRKISDLSNNQTAKTEDKENIEEPQSNNSHKERTSTDNEMQLHKLELENDRLQRCLKDSQHQSKNDECQKLELDNQRLHASVAALEDKLKSEALKTAEKEKSWQESMKELNSARLATEQQVRELSLELIQLQAKSPEVVTRVEHVEVESVASKQALEQSFQALAQSQQETKAVRTQLAVMERKSKDTQLQLSKAREQLSDMKCVQAENSRLQATVDELESSHQIKIKEIDQLQQKIEQVESELVDCKEKSEQEMNSLHQLHDNEMLSLRSSLSEQTCLLKSGVTRMAPIVSNLLKDHTCLRQYTANLVAALATSITETSQKITAALSGVSNQNKELVQKYQKEMELRKQYHNELVELKGNIRVFCRIRPVIKEDGCGLRAENVITYDSDDDALVNVLYKGRVQTFELDRVFQCEVSQQEVFAEVQALVLSCIDGYNVCIFAYGQTGSGKTYTMEGTACDPGINQRALQRLFNEVAHRSSEWHYTISVSMLEIYNEQIRDLLNTQSTDKMEVKMSANGHLHVPGLVNFEVSSVNDVNKVFTLGKENRATAMTQMNEHSSRSHALLCVQVTGTNSTTGAKTLGKLNLVDLAGSERVSKSGADGTRLREAQNINRSLACLGDVIHALRSRQSHVPYRNSRLTYLLQDSLGGDSKTLMIVQVAPVEKNVGETVASLNFGQRVRTVELGTASRRFDSSESNSSTETRGRTLEPSHHLAVNGGSGSRSTTPSRLTAMSRSTTPSRLNTHQSHSRSTTPSRIVKRK